MQLSGIGVTFYAPAATVAPAAPAVAVAPAAPALASSAARSLWRRLRLQPDWQRRQRQQPLERGDGGDGHKGGSRRYERILRGKVASSTVVKNAAGAEAASAAAAGASLTAVADCACITTSSISLQWLDDNCRRFYGRTVHERLFLQSFYLRFRRRCVELFYLERQLIEEV